MLAQGIFWFHEILRLVQFAGRFQGDLHGTTFSHATSSRLAKDMTYDNLQARESVVRMWKVDLHDAILVVVMA